MKEFKIKYSHKKAKSILKEIGARFKEKTILEDFYLKSEGNNIWKISKEKNNLYLVNLVKKAQCFIVRFSVNLDKEVALSLHSFFKNNPLVMKKIRHHYFWKGNEIVLDKVAGLGEFIELYPKDELSRKKLFMIFNIKASELIKKSYYDMLKSK